MEELLPPIVRTVPPSPGRFSAETGSENIGSVTAATMAIPPPGPGVSRALMEGGAASVTVVRRAAKDSTQGTAVLSGDGAVAEGLG